jgi:hypothetical protein
MVPTYSTGSTWKKINNEMPGVFSTYIDITSEKAIHTHDEIWLSILLMVHSHLTLNQC